VAREVLLYIAYAVNSKVEDARRQKGIGAGIES
jgi:hypothetical protein